MELHNISYLWIHSFFKWSLSFFSISLGYIHCTERFIMTILNSFTLYIIHLTLHFHKPLPTSLKQEISSFYFVFAYEVHQPYSFIFISSIHLHSHKHPLNVPILQSSLSFLIPKSMFKGVSQVSPLWMYFTLAISTLHYSPFLLTAISE
jgi:hypothetical protein